MLTIGEYIATDEIQCIYEEILEYTKLENISFRVFDNLEEAVGERNISAGYRYDSGSGVHDFVFESSSLDHINVSHELLHCLLHLKGYFNIQTVIDSSLTPVELAVSVTNFIQHKYIFNWQKDSGLCMEPYIQRTASELAKYEEPENKPGLIKRALNYMNFDMLCEDYRSVYEGHIVKNCPQMYKLARRFFNAGLSKNISDILQYRKAVVRLLRELDYVIDEFDLPRLNLKDVIVVPYYPSKWQMSQTLEQLFNIGDTKYTHYRTGKEFSFLRSKVDGQACYLFLYSNRGVVKSDFSRLTLHEFINGYTDRDINFYRS